MPKLLNKRNIISLDTETTGVDFHHGTKPFLVTTTDSDNNTVFWEWDVDPFTRDPQIPLRDIKEIKELIKSADRLVLQNPKFDARALESIGIRDFPWHKVDDTLMAGHMLASYGRRA